MIGFAALTALEWLVAATALAGATLVAMAWRPMPGPRAGRIATVPALTGVGVIVAVTILYGDELARVVTRLGRPTTVVVLVAGAVVTAIVADFVITRTLPFVAGHTSEMGAALVIPTVAIIGVLALGLIDTGRTGAPAAAATTTTVTTTTTAPQARVRDDFELVASYALDGSPTGMAIDEERDIGFITYGQGAVVRFQPSTIGQSFSPVVVASGLEYPRGVAIAGSQLFVSELGDLPCAEVFPRCVGGSLAEDRIEGEALILEASRGRVLEFPLHVTGDLGDPLTLLDELPVANSDHGVNGLAVGPDGGLFVAVGGPVGPTFPDELLASIDHPHKDWLGTVLRVDLDSGEVTVHASGLRNVYGLAFAPDGTLWGVDNDGATRAGWRGEELLEIGQGDHYGFPHVGSFEPGPGRTEGPVWVIDTTGSAGIAWGQDAGLGPSILTGSCGRLDLIGLTKGEVGWWVNHPRVHRTVMEVGGCITAIGIAGDLIIVAVFGADGGELLVIRSTG